MGTRRKFRGGALHVTTIFLLLFLGSGPGEAKVLGVGAIGMTVSDLDRSVEFFTRVLDFRMVSETEFSREEYDRLTGVFGTRVRVARMQLGEETIDLVEYLAPQGGRPAPEDGRPNDLWHWHVSVLTDDAEELFERLITGGARPVSPQVVETAPLGLGGKKAALVLDPDAHVLQLLER